MKNKKVKINIFFFSCLKINENVSFFRKFFFHVKNTFSGEFIFR